MNTRQRNVSLFPPIFFCLSLVFTLPLQAQTILCDGNLGDNIFTKGDFGSGNANVLPNNPGYAPGFIYTTNVPPDDGEYSVTNDMRVWTGVFPTWIKIGDNDVDPKGYMMVVNASYSPGIFYEQLIDNLCENTLYEFSADIVNLIRKGVANHILPNVSFLLDDVVRYNTGQVPQDENWHTYGFTFITGPGQFSIKLTLRNNAPGGIGNDLALDNISFKACGPESSVSIFPTGKICENSIFPELTAHISADTGSIQWQVSADDQVTWTDIPGATLRTHQVQQLAAGSYYFRYLYSSTSSGLLNPKCRIVSDILLVEVVPVEFLIQDTLCEGLSATLGGMQYTETGIYQHLFTASNGCDSLVTLDLVIVPDPHFEAEFGTTPASCEGAADGSVFLIAVPNLRPPFSVRVNDSILPPPSTLISLPPGTYTAWVETPYGCFDSSTVVVNDGPPLLVQTSNDTSITLGHTVFIHSVVNLPVDTIHWNNLTSLSCPQCLDTYATPVEDITYILTVGSNGVCEAKDSITIRVDRTPVLYVPNVFTPNHDGINDYFSIGVDPFNIISISRALIFDRWGGIISDQANLSTEQEVILWDGMISGEPAMPGVYVYLIQCIQADQQEITLSGDVTLIR